MNSCTFAGRLGRDAETRKTQGGHVATGFSLAVDEYAGQGERRTLWIDCTMWGERGEKLAQYLVKGTPVAVAGQVGVRIYDAQGETRAAITLNVREVTLLGSKQDGDQRPSQPSRQPAASSSKPAPSAPPRTADGMPIDSDIPF